MHGEGISTPRAHHKERQPLIKCAKHDFKIMYFPFYTFYVFSLFVFFLFFWDRQGCYPCFYISIGAMRNLDLRSSLNLKVCVLNIFFYIFERLILITNITRLRFWTLKRCFTFGKVERIVKALDLETIS